MFSFLVLLALTNYKSDTIQQDKAACLVYLRMRHKDPYKGYILCGVVSTSLYLITIKLIPSHWPSLGGCSTFRVIFGQALNCPLQNRRT